MGIKHSIIRWLKRDWYTVGIDLVETPVVNDLASDPNIDLHNGLQFTVMPAQGGTIVQLRQYDRKTDRTNSATHVIPDGEDIAGAIGHIVSMEILRS